MRGRAARAALATLALASVVAAADAQPTTIDLDAIRPGMRGYGLTVFRGTEPERFDVEVIDVLHNFRPGQDLILIRTPHPLLDRAHAVGGMSGSPIFLEGGRLAGAYAYGWTFGTEPVAGVTPIRSMLAEIDRPVRPSPFGRPPVSAARAASTPSPRSTQTFDVHASRDPLDGLRALARARGPITLPVEGPRQATTPLMLGGVTDRVAALLAEELRPFGLEPIQAGGSGQTPVRRRRGARAEGPRFVPGGPIAVQLMRGDFSMAATGTVTHVGSGGRVLAFGHPMMGAGEVALPTALSRVVHVLVSDMRSFKISEPAEPVGTLIHDRNTTIVVDPRRTAPTIPVTIRIRGVSEAPKSEWRVEIASDPTMTAGLAFVAAMNALDVTASDRTDVTFHARATVDVEGLGRLTFEDDGLSSGGLATASALGRLRAFSAIRTAFQNPFTPSRVTAIEIDLDVRFGRYALELVRASTPRARVEAGTTIPIELTFARYDEPDVRRTIEIRIPDDAAGETLKVRLDAGDDVSPERGEPRSLADALAALGDRYPASSVVVSVERESRGLRLRGHAVRHLPRSAFDALMPAGEGSTRAIFATRDRHELPMGSLVVGTAELELEVIPPEHP